MKPVFILFVITLLAIGITCLFFSRAVQGIAIRALEMGALPRAGRIKAFVRSNAYLFNVKAVGCIALLAALFMLLNHR